MSTLQHDASRPYNLQEDDELTQECKDFISSLPTEDSLCQYNGFWIPTCWHYLVEGYLVHHIDCQEHPLLTNNSHVLVPNLDLILYNKNEVPNLTAFTSLRLFSTHLPYVLLPTSVKDSSCKIVYLCRNPKDTFVSLWHFQTKLNWTTDSLEKALDKFCKGVSSFGPYWDNVVDTFLRYEEMKKQPSTHFRRLAKFLGCPFSPEEDAKDAVNDISRLCSFDNLSNLEVNKSGVSSRGVNYAAFFCRGEIGGWVNYFTPQMVEKLYRMIEENFHSIGLKF
ncbi:hypothetical protein I3760_05G047100 [Carya illinoinensis]|nr:hypothetical protein I3760_05G047100 [Carya illinoinensis]